ncbi:acyl carrier protein [Bovifimicola ammoniilytica]|uniref:acyl carrier protein n=1 Tax=Bovifimicola ammoniilytica TaxID=2981720 RepID=UPI000821EA2C|nr:acyl carrier protein [Bovifimicola ammoniilytica]MCI5602400.1 acyl carrier protein [Clostridiales bacterium]MCU6752210.1 acyl carrier protein [Bovifimicola ammoniilytica]MDD6292579.1 acyl carrier protein [Eubacteriales bacterium]SCJ12196.1 D-alanine--poly(phosphoribitol) ligase subunit 2 [uncultured Eubacterium sp.]
MNELLEILNDIDDSIDWENEEGLIDRHLLDSFGVITLVSELEDTFLIEVEASEIVPDNFNSVQAMWKMITRLQEE